MEEIVVSAPGKVLIAGGYLVLDPAYSGLVISTTSKFYTIIRSLKPESTAPAAAAAPAAPLPLVRVRSPQFVGAEWRYGVQIGAGASELDVRPLESAGGCVDLDLSPVFSSCFLSLFLFFFLWGGGGTDGLQIEQVCASCPAADAAARARENRNGARAGDVGHGPRRDDCGGQRFLFTA